jgi:signal transduction histidine kinase
MSKEQIVPGVRAMGVRSIRAGGALSRLRARFRWSSWLGWQQWLVLFFMGALVIGVEVRNHSRMWQRHGSGQTFWTDSELIYEVILFGLVFPILGAVILGYMGRTAIERDKLARELEYRRALVGQMQEAQSWPELAELVVATPGIVVSADRAWLLAQRSGDEEFDEIVHWERLGSGSLPPYSPVTPAVCERCAEAPSLKKSRIFTCHHMDPGSSASRSNRYCLWLSAEGAGKTALLFDIPSERFLDPDQMKVLDDLGDEMSLAIDNANLHYVERRQIDVARNERLRIARDLHDSLGQNVSVLRLKLERLNDGQLTSGDAEFQDELASMLAVADEAYEQVRETLEELRSTEQPDLEQAVRLYASQVSERAGCSVRVHSSEHPGTLSTMRNRQIMYIVREALNNVEKHACAQNVDIRLHWSDGEFRLTVRDDGKGFEPQELNTEGHYGMAIMDERSRAINALLVIESTPGEGTKLTLSLPLSRGAVAASNAGAASRSQ